jgi:hypothetical protein
MIVLEHARTLHPFLSNYIKLILQNSLILYTEGFFCIRLSNENLIETEKIALTRESSTKT